MARIEPLPLSELEQHDERFELTRSLMGFLPNSMPTMARVPGLVEAFSDLGAAVIANQNLSPELVEMVAQITSSAAGCRYCQAHTGHVLERLGTPGEKIADLWLFETSEHFSDAERAALRLAFNAGLTPNAATDDDFAELAHHYDENQIAGIVAAIAMFGFLNRWNDTVATDLEEAPAAFGSHTLAANGWTPGKHQS